MSDIKYVHDQFSPPTPKEEKTNDTLQNLSQTVRVETTTNQPASRKTLTNWKVFDDAGFLPAKIKWDGYQATHPSGMSCHTTFQPTSENGLRHLDPDHGGGWFRIKFRVSNKFKSPLWNELKKAGIELKDFYCPHCRQQVEVSARRIMYHLNPHPGANRMDLT